MRTPLEFAKDIGDLDRAIQCAVELEQERLGRILTPVELRYVLLLCRDWLNTEINELKSI
jgi:hypothetical protein